MNVLLKGIVGSTAYGLDHEGSDIDRLGLFAAPTSQILGLDPVQESVVTKDPDLTMHEAKKFVKLAAKCNPTITDLLWLPMDLYEVTSLHGCWLIGLRKQFLSRAYVRNAYFGYATQQFQRLKNTGRFDSDIPDRRAAKHARHLYRLLVQGYDLYSTGEMTVRLSDDEASTCRRFGDRVAEGDLARVMLIMSEYENLFDTCKSPLPVSYPATTGDINDWLLDVRKEHWNG